MATQFVQSLCEGEPIKLYQLERLLQRVNYRHQSLEKESVLNLYFSHGTPSLKIHFQHQSPVTCVRIIRQILQIHFTKHRPSIMGVLLDSSWMRFGPAGKGSDDWVTRSPSIQEQQNFHWNEPESGEDSRSFEFMLCAVLPVISILLLVLLAALIYRCCSHSKFRLANIVTLDLQDADSSAEFLASLTRNAERHASTTSNGSDGVFVMVYLSPPYEGTLSKIPRAASLSSSKDVESMKAEDLEAQLCPDLKSSSQ